MPAHSMTARTAPPAITPAPGAAGFISTLPAPCWPTISCGIVPPVSGMLTMLRRARVDGLADRFRDFVRLARREADLALPVADGDERVEREAAAALHDLRDAVDRDHVLDELAAAVAAPPSPPRPPRRHRRRRDRHGHPPSRAATAARSAADRRPVHRDRRRDRRDHRRRDHRGRHATAAATAAPPRPPPPPRRLPPPRDALRRRRRRSAGRRRTFRILVLCHF